MSHMDLNEPVMGVRCFQGKLSFHVSFLEKRNQYNLHIIPSIRKKKTFIIHKRFVKFDIKV